MTLKQISEHLTIDAESLYHGIRVYLWSEETVGLPCHWFSSLDAAVAAYGDKELDYYGRSIHIYSDRVVVWLE